MGMCWLTAETHLCKSCLREGVAGSEPDFPVSYSERLVRGIAFSWYLSPFRLL